MIILQKDSNRQDISSDSGYLPSRESVAQANSVQQLEGFDQDRLRSNFSLPVQHINLMPNIDPYGVYLGTSVMSEPGIQRTEGSSSTQVSLDQPPLFPFVPSNYISHQPLVLPHYQQILQQPNYPNWPCLPWLGCMGLYGLQAKLSHQNSVPQSSQLPSSSHVAPNLIQTANMQPKKVKNLRKRRRIIDAQELAIESKRLLHHDPHPLAPQQFSMALNSARNDPIIPSSSRQLDNSMFMGELGHVGPWLGQQTGSNWFSPRGLYTAGKMTNSPNNVVDPVQKVIRKQARKQGRKVKTVKRAADHLKKNPKTKSTSEAVNGDSEKNFILQNFPRFNQKYQLLEKLGRGGGGVVFVAQRRSDNIKVAVKKPTMSYVKRWGDMDGRMVPVEFPLYKQAAENNPGVVQMYDWYECNNEYLLVMEYPIRSGDLFDLIAKPRKLTEQQAKKIFIQVVRAIQKCHQNGVVHRDVKDENVLVDPETFEAKIIDFGCADRLKDGDYNEFAGTPEFYPPEWFTQRRYKGERLDAWSLGVLLYTMIESDIPKVLNNQGEYLEITFKRSKEEISDQCRSLILRIMQIDENLRPTLSEILKDPWMQ